MQPNPTVVFDRADGNVVSATVLTWRKSNEPSVEDLAVETVSDGNVVTWKEGLQKTMVWISKQKPLAVRLETR